MAKEYYGRARIQELLWRLKTQLSAKADKETSLSGYGITDAYNKTTMDLKLNNLKKSVYGPAPTISVELLNLPSPDANHLGYIYNVTDGFETTSQFVEGAGILVPANTKVGIINIDTTEINPTYKYIILGTIPSEGSTDLPQMNGTAAAGTSTSWSKSDHVHPSDNSKLSLSVLDDVGSKNLFEVNFESPTIINRVTITKHIDTKYDECDYIETTGKAIAQTDLIIGTITLQPGSYILSGCPANGSASTYRLEIADGSDINYDFGEGVTITPAEETTYTVQLSIIDTTRKYTLQFKPMVRPVGTSDTFVPHVMTNRELMMAIKQLQSSAASS